MMSQQAMVTVIGYVGQEPKRISHDQSIPVCRFRIAATRNYWNRRAQQWQEASTTWLDVRCYRELATNVLTSVHVGDPVIVVGNVTTDQWQKDGRDHSMTIIDATGIGHDLALGRSAFIRMKPSQQDSAEESVVHEPGGAEGKALLDESGGLNQGTAPGADEFGSFEQDPEPSGQPAFQQELVGQEA